MLSATAAAARPTTAACARPLARASRSATVVVRAQRAEAGEPAVDRRAAIATAVVAAVGVAAAAMPAVASPASGGNPGFGKSGRERAAA
jgi:hypothetical protein